MWYVELNGKPIMAEPYQYFSDCMDACIEMKKRMCAVRTRPVFIE